jgi:putative membrane protein
MAGASPAQAHQSLAEWGLLLQAHACRIMEKPMRRTLAGLVLGIPLAVFGAVSVPDHSFFTAAAHGGIAEVADGKLAEVQGKSREVIDFGTMMVKDHTAANEQLQKIAVAQAVTLPSRPTQSQVSTHEKLQRLSGPSFDKAYMQSQIKAHEETVTLFKKEVATGKNAETKSFASEQLPIFQSHLEKARSIYAGLGR